MESSESPEDRNTSQLEKETILEASNFYAGLAVSCMNELRNTWYDVIIYYDELKQNAKKANEVVKNIIDHSRNAINLTVFAGLLASSYTADMHFEKQSLNNLPATNIASAHDHDNSELTGEKILRQQLEMKGNLKHQTESVFQPSRIPYLDDDMPSEKPVIKQQQEENIELSEREASVEKYGEFALSAPNQVNEDIIFTVVQEYREGDNRSDEVSKYLIENSKKYELNVETVMTIILQEGSFGKITGNKSGRNNPGNLKDPVSGKFANFKTLKGGVEAVFWQIHRYDKEWPSEKNDDTIHTLDTALQVYAPPYDKNPTQERIDVGKRFITELRNLSQQYENGEISKSELGERVQEIRVTIKQDTGSEYI